MKKINRLKCVKPSNKYYSNGSNSTPFKLMITWVFLMLSFLPLGAQRSDSEVDQLRAKVEEAFIQNVVILSTAVIEATEDLPTHVLIRGYTMPSNYFLMRFPVDQWNEKIFIGGCGLGCGTLPTDISGKLKTALQRGYATATMNSGHWSTSIRDFSWADNNPQAEREFSHRAVHETLRATQELIKTFYEQEPSYSYFWGCSTGGRQAVMAASRYPTDFDGVISEAPVINWTDVVILMVWLRQTNTGPDGKDILTKEDLPLISRAVYDVCDKLDGKADGLVSEPAHCRFDPEDLICWDEKNCLSREKVEVLKKWYQGPVNEKGEKLLNFDLPISSEPFWGFWLLGESDDPFDEFIPSEEMLRYIVFKEDPGDDYSVFDFDFNTDPERMDYMGNILNVDHLSLQSFKDEGGKMLIYHGFADPVIPYQLSVDYYNQNYKEYGEETKDFFRLFLIPGMDHCTAFRNLGITGDSVDPLSALEDWVEKDQPPLQLPVTRYNQDGTVMSGFVVKPHIPGN